MKTKPTTSPSDKNPDSSNQEPTEAPDTSPPIEELDLALRTLDRLIAERQATGGKA
jgi:hypothetical protein